MNEILPMASTRYRYLGAGQARMSKPTGTEKVVDG